MAPARGLTDRGRFLVSRCRGARIQWDSVKSLKNKLKHGAWLSAAPAVWDDPRRKMIRGRSKDGESRFHAFGIYQGKVWQAVFALRAGKIRFISFRPAKRKDRDAHYRR